MFNKAGLKFVANGLCLFNILVLLCACSNNPQPKQAIIPQKKKSAFEPVLAKCKNLQLDTLHVYSVGNLPDAKHFEFLGVSLDSAERSLFMPMLNRGEVNSGGNIYVCYKMQMDETHTGIIARTPAMYDDSSIKFFTLDNAADSITDFVELAEIWGDAGDALEKQAWLYKNNEQKLTAFLWQTTTHDNSVENPANTKVEETNDYYLLDLSKPKHDTLSRNAADLLKTFQHKKRN